MHRVILHGSCRADGRSAALADQLFNACIDECPDDGVSIVSVSSVDVAPCTGCDACRAVSDEPVCAIEEGDPLQPQAAVAASGAPLHHCVIDDDMAEVRKHLDAADELVVVCPVYFASVPAQMKALLDRLQPYYYTDLRTRPKRPAVIHVVGAGGDPHGFDPLIGTVRSALSVAGFSVELVLDWVGKVAADGEVTAEADEHSLPPLPGSAPEPRPHLDLGGTEGSPGAREGNEAGNGGRGSKAPKGGRDGKAPKGAQGGKGSRGPKGSGTPAQKGRKAVKEAAPAKARRASKGGKRG